MEFVAREAMEGAWACGFCGDHALAEQLLCQRCGGQKGDNLGNDPVLRSRALTAVGEFGSKATPFSEAIAKAALKDSVIGVRLAAADTIGKLGDHCRPAQKMLLAALDDDDVEVRKAAARALAAVGYEEGPEQKTRSDLNAYGMKVRTAADIRADQKKKKAKKKKGPVHADEDEPPRSPPPRKKAEESPRKVKSKESGDE